MVVCSLKAKIPIIHVMPSNGANTRTPFRPDLLKIIIKIKLIIVTKQLTHFTKSILFMLGSAPVVALKYFECII